jgi:CheY-like chemotaxis protein
MRILVAEDHTDNRELLMRRLTRRGHEVHGAENGAEAVDRTLALSPDVVLMDLSMPIMSGLDATRAIRAAGFDTRIIALTAHVMPEARQECFDAGCNAFASKPVDFVGLVALLETPSGTPTP